MIYSFVILLYTLGAFSLDPLINITIPISRFYIIYGSSCNDHGVWKDGPEIYFDWYYNCYDHTMVFTGHDRNAEIIIKNQPYSFANLSIEAIFSGKRMNFVLNETYTDITGAVNFTIGDIHGGYYADEFTFYKHGTNIGSIFKLWCIWPALIDNVATDLDRILVGIVATFEAYKNQYRGRYTTKLCSGCNPDPGQNPDQAYNWNCHDTTVTDLMSLDISEPHTYISLKDFWILVSIIVTVLFLCFTCGVYVYIKEHGNCFGGKDSPEGYQEIFV